MDATLRLNGRNSLALSFTRSDAAHWNSRRQSSSGSWRSPASAPRHSSHDRCLNACLCVRVRGQRSFSFTFSLWHHLQGTAALKELLWPVVCSAQINTCSTIDSLTSLNRNCCVFPSLTSQGRTRCFVAAHSHNHLLDKGTMGCDTTAASVTLAVFCAS